MNRPALLIVNLGTPRSPKTGDVRRYLREFLSDPFVIDLPWLARKALLEGVILPFRPRASAAAYREIWTERGSPLLFHGVDLRDGLRAELGREFTTVELAMRYGEPRIDDAVTRILDSGADGLVVLPLFPQYARSSWASAVAAVDRALAAQPAMLPTRVISPYFDAGEFIVACASVTQRALDGFDAERVVMSFHGLPERHVTATDLATDGETRCLAGGCCEQMRAGNRFCYRAQSFATARALATALELGDSDYEVAFQSRLGRTPWIRPFTDERIAKLGGLGVKRLAVVCPSFVADCLETIEEIGIRARELFREHGGEELRLVPCVNSDPAWVRGAAALARAEIRRTEVLSGSRNDDTKVRPDLSSAANS